MTFYLVISSDQGLEGSFPNREDAEAYLKELKGIGVTGLRIEVKDVKS